MACKNDTEILKEKNALKFAIQYKVFRIAHLSSLSCINCSCVNIREHL